MYWTLELASKLEDAPWPATKDELIDYAMRSGAPLEVIENLQEMEDEDEIYESIEDIWPDYPSKEDFFFNEKNIKEVYTSVPVLYIPLKIIFSGIFLFVTFIGKVKLFYFSENIKSNERNIS